MSEWISVKDKLPEDTLPSGSKAKQIKVLVAIKAKNGITVRTQLRMKPSSYYQIVGYTAWEWKFSGGEVTHWMPLPPPPEEAAP